MLAEYVIVANPLKGFGFGVMFGMNCALTGLAVGSAVILSALIPAGCSIFSGASLVGIGNGPAPSSLNPISCASSANSLFSAFVLIPGVSLPVRAPLCVGPTLAS